MKRLHFSISINAPKENVWDLMLNEDTYPEWTEPFMPGAYFEGTWEEGSKMLFLAPHESGEAEGMVSRIRKNRPYEYISIEHLGFVKDGKEDVSSESVKSWAGAQENYSFLEENGGSTKVLIEMDTTGEYEEMFLETWPKALQKLKELAEG